MTPSKITEGLLHAGFMQLFFNSKKERVESFEKALYFRPMALWDLKWKLPLRRFTDWMTTEDKPRLTSLFEACLDLFTAASSKKSLITEIKMARAANDSFRDNRRLRR